MRDYDFEVHKPFPMTLHNDGATRDIGDSEIHPRFVNLVQFASWRVKQCQRRGRSEYERINCKYVPVIQLVGNCTYERKRKFDLANILRAVCFCILLVCWNSGNTSTCSSCHHLLRIISSMVSKMWAWKKWGFWLWTTPSLIIYLSDHMQRGMLKIKYTGISVHTVISQFACIVSTNGAELFWTQELIFQKLNNMSVRK